MAALSRLRARAAERGFATMRLLHAADHVRARRFYERGDWTLHAPPVVDPAFGMAIVEYRREV